MEDFQYEENRGRKRSRLGVFTGYCKYLYALTFLYGGLRKEYSQNLKGIQRIRWYMPMNSAYARFLHKAEAGTVVQKTVQKDGEFRVRTGN